MVTSLIGMQRRYNACGHGRGGVTWVKCTYLGLLGELRDDKAGFSSDDSVVHRFQTWAIIVSIHSYVVAYCVAVTGICMHAWTSLKGSSEQVHPTYYYAWWASTTIMAMQRHRPIKLSIFWVSVALLSLIGCLPQTTIFNESTVAADVTLPTNIRITTEESPSDGTTTLSQPQ